MKQSIIVLLLVFSSHWSLACDVCGGSSFLSESILGSINNNRIGLTYRYAAGTALPSAGLSTEDRFQAFSFQGVVFYKQKWFATFSIPYIQKDRVMEGGTQLSTGIGDAWIIGNRVLLKNADSKKYLDIGIGLKLKNGQYDNNIIDRDLPKSFNPGNGSMGYQLRSTYIKAGKRLGFRADASYTFFSETFTGHKFGDYGILKLFLFREIKVKKGMLSPNLAAIIYKVEPDTYPNSKAVESTGGNQLQAQIGVNHRWKNWQLGLSEALPIWESNKSSSFKHNLNIQLNYLF